MTQADDRAILDIYLEIKNDERLGALDRDLAMNIARFIYKYMIGKQENESR